MVLSVKDRIDKGREFQEYVRMLLSQVGYLEGQLYSTGCRFEEDYYERLQRLGKDAYTSPDITILNSWDITGSDLDKRFGLACSRRDATFDRFGNSCVTFPRYQSRSLREIQDDKGLPMYIIFGRQIVESVFAIAISNLGAPDECMQLVDQSTGSNRWTDIYYTANLWSWASFIQHRIDIGDREPSLEKCKAVPRLM